MVAFNFRQNLNMEHLDCFPDNYNCTYSSMCLSGSQISNISDRFQVAVLLNQGRLKKTSTGSQVWVTYSHA